MEQVSENPLLFCRNLQANESQCLWDTLYYSPTMSKSNEVSKKRFQRHSQMFSTFSKDLKCCLIDRKHY